MKKFIYRTCIFLILLFIFSEILIRLLNVVSDIPERYVDEYGVQRYIPEQNGRYDRIKWKTNEYGWIGLSETEGEVISIIGDSYIENLMNPITCNQGYLLKEHLPNYSFFEAGRSGITLIEALKISSILENEIHPKLQLLYLSTGDFSESISNIHRYSDRYQVDLETNEEKGGAIRGQRLKKILYNIKTLYYLYQKYPVFVAKQNKAEDNDKSKTSISYDKYIPILFDYIADNYDLNTIIFVFHPGINQDIIRLAEGHGIEYIELQTNEEETQLWRMSDVDGHWSCYGHAQVSAQVAKMLEALL
ncbi:MAG: hypothetical protein RBR15_10045 [Sphaerochaeta sp.]|nr:hypothetical protein [Sphaerochaeta sp.]